MINLIDTLDKNDLAKEVEVGYQTSSMIKFKAKKVENGDYIITRISVDARTKILTTAYTPEGVSDLLYEHAFKFIDKETDFLYFRNQAGQGEQIAPNLVRFKLYLERARQLNPTCKQIAGIVEKQRQARVGEGDKAARACLERPPSSIT